MRERWLRRRIVRQALRMYAPQNAGGVCIASWNTVSFEASCDCNRSNRFDCMADTGHRRSAYQTYRRKMQVLLISLLKSPGQRGFFVLPFYQQCGT